LLTSLLPACALPGGDGRFQVMRIIRAALALLKAEICQRGHRKDTGKLDFPGTSNVLAVRGGDTLGYTSGPLDPDGRMHGRAEKT